MLRKFVALAVAVLLQATVPSWAADYSPSQAELNSVQFIDFWPGNGASLDSKTLIGPQGSNPNPGVRYQFDTGPANPPDAFGTRTQFEAPFTVPLSGYDAFTINFLTVQAANPLQAQIYLRYGPGGTGFTASGAVNLNGSSQTTVSIPIGVIPAADRDAITAFGIEIFSLDSTFHEPETDARVAAFTTPQYADSYLISGFEGDGTGSLDGWGPAFQPDHISHTLVSKTPQLPDHPPNNGVTQGNYALEVVRQYTGQGLPNEPTNLEFRWGSQMTLNAGSGGPVIGDYNDDGNVDAGDYVRWRNNLGGPATTLQNRDPGNLATTVGVSHYSDWKSHYGDTGSGSDPVQQRITDIVNAINGGDQIAMDISFTAVDNFETGEPNPSYAIFHMFIQDGQEGGAFWQSDAFATINAPPLGESVTVTLVAGLESFTARGPMAPPGNLKDVDLVATPSFTLGIASNTNGRLKFQIDNIRVRSLATGSGGIATVPEPMSALLGCVAALVVGVVTRRRRGE